jgi:CsoR family transcriptional regulator, copper-sensing transcriptional repressor
VSPSVVDCSRDAVVVRLRKIEGQVRGLQRMVDERASDSAILVQIASVRAALTQVGLAVLDERLRDAAGRPAGVLPEARAELLRDVSLLIGH